MYKTRGRREVSQGCRKIFTCRFEHKGISSIPHNRFSEADVAQRICCRRLFKVKLCHIYPSSHVSASYSPGPWQHSITSQGMPGCARGLHHLTPARKRMPKSFSGEQERSEELLMILKQGWQKKEARASQLHQNWFMGPSASDPAFMSQFSLLTPI